MEELIDEEDEFEKALAIAEKKVQSYGNIEDYKKYRKLNDFLLRRGFDYDIVSKVITTLRNR